jgi:DNA-3-methyladenine glycosylase II
MKPDRSDVKPNYWDRAKRALARKDPVMSSIMKTHKGIHLIKRGEPFLTLARAIVGQQISVKAAQSVWDRVVACAGAVTPEGILLKKPTELRACGLSDRKTEYIVDLARRFAEGLVHPYRWDEMSDEEVIADLVQVRGIGRWTAEMFLIFNLLRPDVFPLDDLGLQKAIRVSYFRKRPVSVSRMRKLGESWRPWRSVATWYLWRSLDPVPVEY